MDFNDNDYQGHNLHLAGEDNSKHSSSSRSFVLPKFDFDDNLHRFDSLVDNGGFLGQDDQWIEDFSRGSSGIQQYCSSATVSCALPRCNNVWSEATSSESVEMLLKAVGQEDMIPGANMVNQSDLANQVDLTGTNSRQDENMYDIDGVKLAGIEGLDNAAEPRDFNKENCLIATDTELDTDKRITEDKGEGLDLVNDSSSKQVQESLLVSRSMTDNFDSSHQVHDPMLVDQNNIMNTSFGSFGHISEGTALGVDEQLEDPIANEEIFDGKNDQNVNSEMGCSLQLPPVAESLNEEYIAETQVNKIEKTVRSSESNESVSSVDDCSKLTFDVEPVIVASISGNKHRSEVHSVSHDRPSMSSGDERRLDIKDSDCTPDKTVAPEPIQVSVIQLSDQQQSHTDDEDIYPGSSSLDAQVATIEPPTPSSPERNDKSNCHRVDDPDNLVVSSFSGIPVQENPVIECSKEPVHTTTLLKESAEDKDHVSLNLVDGNKLMSGEDELSKQIDDNSSMPTDVQVGEHDLSEKVDKLILSAGNMVSHYNGKETGDVFSVGVVEVNVETTTGSQSSVSAEDCHVHDAKVKDKKLKSSCSEGEELVDDHGQNSPSLEMGSMDQNKELEAEIQPITLNYVPPPLDDVSEVAMATKFENMKRLDPVDAGGIKTDDPPVSLFEISNSTLPDEATLDLSKKVENPSNDGSEIMHSDKTTEPTVDISSEANPSKVLGCDSAAAAAEIDDSSQPGPSSASVIGQGESELNKKDVLEKDVENVGTVLPTSINSEVNTLSKQEGSFTFDIRPLGSQRTEDTDKRLQQVPIIRTVQSLTGEGIPVTSGSCQKDTVTAKEISQPASLIPSGGAPSSEGVKCSSNRKPRRRTSKAGKESVKRENMVKETTLPHQTERLDKLPVFPSPLGACQLIKPMTGDSVSSSSLPDLNSSGPSSARQPFTNLQQVQLRAQIFVYGSLIQGAPPDEAFMVSAFDGGRGAWESSWRAFIEKRRDKQKIKSETPLQTRSVSIAPEQTSNHGFSQSEVFSTPVGRTTDKAAPSPLANPIIPLSSPLWNVTTPSCAGLPSSTKPRFDYPAVSPLHPFQTPPIQGFAPHSTTWPSQPPYPVPWLTSSTGSAFDIRPSYPASSITEPIILTPVIESSMPAKKHVPHVPAIHTGSTSVFTGTTRGDLKKVTVSTSQMTPSETKTRKRKKSSDVDAVHIHVTAAQVDSVSTSVLANTLPKIVDSVSISGHNSMPITVPTLGITSNQVLSAVLPSVSNDKRALDLESSGKVEEAKLHAEQAAELATEAVNHCQSVWSTLDQQMSSGITSDAESKLVSAAVAVAAAASVAKAAAAAAKIASNAAVQAKQIADEAIINNITANPGSTTPASIFWSGDENNASTSDISTARQAARKRVEATSAGSRQAENLDAIIKAAELAAEAVSHTGKIVGMGDPFTLNELVRAGPDGYWRISLVDPASTSEPVETNKNEVFAQEHPNVSKNVHLVPDKDLLDSGHVMPPSPTTNLIDSVESEENNVKQHKDKGVFNSVETIGTVSESDIELRSTSFTPYEISASIKEGSVVEVLKDHGNIKKAWYSAKVLSLQGGKALVCYTELHSDEGSDPEEWISLQPQVGEAPVIRVARPSKVVQHEGTRKRRRSATGDNAWSVGDRVDARVKDCWREGIIKEKNKKDPDTLTVNFPAEEEILIVKACDLRPTLIWSDNQWSECWRQGENDISKGDMPLEKRPKLGTFDIKSKGEDNMVKKTGFPKTGTSSEQLPLSSKETIFNIGSKNDENNVRTMRPGLQKEGPRVMFGVPEPGKKRKFMEVSKHYGSERTNKTTLLNNSAKSAKSSLPLGCESRVLKNNPKTGTKEKKQVPGSKPRKPPVPTRTLLRKGDSTSSQPNTSTATSSDRPFNGSTTSTSHDDNESGEQNVNELGPFSNVEGTSTGTFVFSSRAASTENRKKTVIRRARPERLNKGKIPPKSGKSAENESDGKLESEVSGPRRSNRRIQPTSRLLEGLQSSLIIPKFLSSHDKGQRSHRGNDVQSQ